MDYRINLFGSVRLMEAEGEPVAFPTASAKSLFCFLVLNRRRMYPRDVLSGVFWGDTPGPTARKNLRNDIWRIRNTLEAQDRFRGKYVLTVGDSIGIRDSPDLWVDVEEFERRIDATGGTAPHRLTEDHTESLRRAVALYRGDLMEEIYEDWCLVAQQRLKARLLDTIERIMRYHEARAEWTGALRYGQQILRTDPLREYVLRDVMRYHYFRGNRPAALQQFETFAALLEAEMGIAPMRQTLRLRDAIRTEALESENPLTAAPAEASAPEAVVGPYAPLPDGEVRDALLAFDRATARLRASIARRPAAERCPTPHGGDPTIH